MFLLPLRQLIRLYFLFIVRKAEKLLEALTSSTVIFSTCCYVTHVLMLSSARLIRLLSSWRVAISMTSAKLHQKKIIHTCSRQAGALESCQGRLPFSFHSVWHVFLTRVICEVDFCLYIQAQAQPSAHQSLVKDWMY